MNKTVTINSRNHKNQYTYGGAVNQSDFNTEYEGSRNIAERIVSDWKFDIQCYRNAKNRKK